MKYIAIYLPTFWNVIGVANFGAQIELRVLDPQCYVLKIYYPDKINSINQDYLYMLLLYL